MVDYFITEIVPSVKQNIEIVVNIVKDALEVIINGIKFLLDSLGGILDFISDVFKGDWRAAWNDIRDIFDGWKTYIGNIAKGAVNLIIDAINALWKGLYSTLRLVVNGVGGILKGIGKVVGQDWGFEVPATAPLIPRLATGAVIPPNAARLAVVGDNKYENELIAPESTFRKIVKEELASAGGKDISIEISIPMDGETIARKVIKIHNGIVRQTGASPLLV